MNQYKSSAELKSLSKGQLLGKYNAVILAFLLYVSCNIGIYSFCLLTTMRLTPPVSTLFQWILNFLVRLLTGVFTVGNAALYLNIARGRQYRSFDLFAGFKHHADKAIRIGFVLTVIEYLLLAPGYFLNLLYQSYPSGILFLTVRLSLVIGSAVLLFVNLMYSQWSYLLLDHPDYGTRETLRLCRERMRGHKGSRFYLAVSFLPLWLLSSMSVLGLAAFLPFSMIVAFVPVMFLFPYQNMTYANFYLDRITREEPSSDVTGTQIDIAADEAVNGNEIS